MSNHGGRNEETLRATIDCLAEVIGAVRKRLQVFLDGGIRRGTDVFKALALGAAGVGIGRPQAWGLAAFGQPGSRRGAEHSRYRAHQHHAPGGNRDAGVHQRRATGAHPGRLSLRSMSALQDLAQKSAQVGDFFRAQ